MDISFPLQWRCKTLQHLLRLGEACSDKHSIGVYLYMAESNPLMDAYPELSPSCSKRVYCIAGIQTTVYGIEELQPAEHVACLWLLHPRLQDQSCMAPLAFSTIDTWNSYVSSSRGPPRMPGLIAVSFDQRNHGTREVDPRANRDWRTGNYTHASDMFANYGLTHLKRLMADSNGS